MLCTAVGFTNGNVHILDSLSLNSMQTEPFRLSRSSITHVAFSYDSQYLATAVSLIGFAFMQ